MKSQFKAEVRAVMERGARCIHCDQPFTERDAKQKGGHISHFKCSNKACNRTVTLVQAIPPQLALPPPEDPERERTAKILAFVGLGAKWKGGILHTYPTAPQRPPP